jgi:HEAT repeat protein
VRQHAANAIGHSEEMGQPASPALRRLLNDPVPEVRGRGAWALGRVRSQDESTLHTLREMVSTGLASDRSAALHALGNIGKSLADNAPLRPMRQLFVRALEDEDEHVRWSALYALESVPPAASEYVSLLIRAVEDPYESVCGMALGTLKELAATTDISSATAPCVRVVDRGASNAHEACETLGAIGPQAVAAVPSLLNALRRDDARVAIKAAEALWKIDRRVEESLPILAAWLHKDPIGEGDSVCDALCSIGPAAAPLRNDVLRLLEMDDYWDIHWGAADALGAIASDAPEVIASLVHALVSHKSGIVCTAAARALGRIGTSAVPALIHALEQCDDDRRDWVADALGQIGPGAAAAVEPLRKFLSHPNRNTRAWCAIALGKTAASKDVIDALIQALECLEGSNVRRQAAEALERIGPTAVDAIPALQAVVEDEDEDEEVREAATRALAKIEARD